MFMYIGVSHSRLLYQRFLANTPLSDEENGSGGGGPGN